MDDSPAGPHHHFVQAPIRPLDEDGVQAFRIGTLVWLVAGGLLWWHRDELQAQGRGWWLWVSVCGILVGVAGLAWCTRRRGARAQ